MKDGYIVWQQNGHWYAAYDDAYDDENERVAGGATAEEAIASLLSSEADEADDYDDCPLDGDHDSTMESIGWGTDEDYGYFGDDF